MAPVEQVTLSSVSISNMYEPETWIFTLLCCTYALPSLAFGHSVNTKPMWLSSFQTGISFQNFSGITHAKHISQYSENGRSGDNYALNSHAPQKRDSYSIDSRDTSLKRLLLIDNWAQKNRINSTDFKRRKNTRRISNLSRRSLSKKTNTSMQRKKYQKRIVKPYDKKVFVYGKDDRLRIYPSLLRKFPYSNIVRLSTGCTGTLVTPQHVLTAAHCVHTGVDFRNNLEMLKVEIPDSMGVRAYYIEKIGIPGRWLHPKNIHEHQASWDYAIVKLSFGVHGRSQFFPLAVPTAGVLNENLQFLGFPNNKDDLWLSVCPARSNKAMVDGNLILTRCDSAVGNSGAAVLSDDSREGKKIIGVLSSTMPVGRMPYYTQFSIITALTWAKLYDICAEIGEIGVQHRVCPPLGAIPRPRRFHISNNVIPFFG